MQVSTFTTTSMHGTTTHAVMQAEPGKFYVRYVSFQPHVPYTPEQLAETERLARRITDAMRAHAERHNEVHGDYADGERYLRDEASDDELDQLVSKWSKIDANKE